jgi:hypothetical protein
MSRLSLSCKPFRLLIISALVLTIAFPVFFVHLAVAQTDDGYYSKSFAWDYGGQHWTWNLSIPAALYDAYKAVPVSTRTQDGPAGYGFCTTTEDYYIQSLAEKLNETTTGYSSYDQVSFVLAFVQSLPYTSDNVTEGYNEYPRFPIETLVDGGGDCEDTSILFATLTLIMGYGTVYINPPNHYAVGILGNNIKGGTYWTYPEGSNKTYYYCETTGSGFKIGELPEEFSGQSAYIYTIDKNKQFVPDIALTSTPQPTSTDTTITTAPTPTIQPNPTGSALPTVAQPTIQPALPLSFDLITENPPLFITLVLAIVLSIGLAVWSARRGRSSTAAPPSESTLTSMVYDDKADGSKFCIYCGSSNKAYATYCAKCGKKIG